MPTTANIGALPAFAALETVGVLTGHRRGASLQLTETYFNGQLQILQALDHITGFEKRIKTLKHSSNIYADFTLNIESIGHEDLVEASHQFHQFLQQLPEVNALKNTFPGTCIAVPEWVRTPTEVKYGARIYFFREGEAPNPDEIIQTNIESIVNENRTPFDQYQGQLHGYPECCIEFLQERISESPPETRSIRPFSNHVDDELLKNTTNTSRSISEVLPTISSSDGFYAFFARAFYPEPDCEPARTKGREIYNEIKDTYGETLATDHFRINFGTSYMRGRGVVEGAKNHPTPGILGKEHLYFYLPLQSLQTLSRSPV